MRPLPALACALALLGAAALHAQDSESRISASDLLRVKTLETPAISPDGTQVVYTVRGLTPATDGPRDAHSPTSQLWLVAIDGTGGPHALTPDDSLASAPAWSPKGDRIAYIRSEPGADRARLWIHAIDGKGADFAVTPALTDLSPPRWSPDGTRLLFTARVTATEVDAALALAAKRTSPKNPHPRPILKLFVPPDPIIPDPDGNQTQRRAWLAANVPLVIPQAEAPTSAVPEAATYTHIFTIEAKPNKTPNDLTPERGDYTQPAWSADGRDIYCVGLNFAEKIYGLCALTADGSAIKPLPSREKALYFSPTPSPDGRSLVFVAWPAFDAGPYTLDLLNIADGKTTVLTANPDHAPRDPRWSPDGKFIYFTVPVNGSIALYRVPPTGSFKNPPRLNAPDSGIRGYSVSSDNLALVVAKASDPSELYASDPDGTNQSILTMHNSDWLRYKNPANFEYHQIKRPDKSTASYWLLRPPYFEGGMRYPLLLALHSNEGATQGPGGPPKDWLPLQFFASRGYAVLVCNNLPDTEDAEDRTDYDSASGPGSKPYSDLLAVVSDCTDRNPWIDPDREVVLGNGSWFAFWRLLADTRFKAAILEDGIPFFAKAQTVRTPLFLVQSEASFPADTARAQNLYESLKALGRPVEYALYPRVASGADHTAEATQQIDRLVRADDFFRRHIGDPAQPAPKPPVVAPEQPAAPAPPATPKASTSTTATAPSAKP